jgi:NADH dehydrogenase
VVLGDLKDRTSLGRACAGVDTVVSTASSTLSRQEGDSIESVDRQGQLALIDAAESARVKHFVLVSFGSFDLDFPLQSAKRAAEERLRAGRMRWTILQPTFFTEVWLSPALGFDIARGTAQIYGNGQNKISWISVQDVAQFVVAAIDSPRAANSVIRLGGPEALSPLEVVSLAEETIGTPITVQHVPEEALRAQYGAATDPLQQSFAALMLNCASGDVIDMTETLRLLPVPPLRSVQQHLRAGR